VPAAAGNGFTVIAKLGLTVPFPQLFTPLTVRLPEVALEAKFTVTELVVPVIVAPVPEYDHK
jgi:hypothetical protein